MKLNKEKLEILKEKWQNLEEYFDNNFSSEEQEFILNFHNEGATQQHCLRWGLQGAEELYKYQNEEVQRKTTIAGHDINIYIKGLYECYIEGQFETTYNDIEGLTLCWSID